MMIMMMMMMIIIIIIIIIIIKSETALESASWGPRPPRYITYVVHHIEHARRYPSPLRIHIQPLTRDSEIRRDGHAIDETEGV